MGGSESRCGCLDDDWQLSNLHTNTRNTWPYTHSVIFIVILAAEGNPVCHFTFIKIYCIQKNKTSGKSNPISLLSFLFLVICCCFWGHTVLFLTVKLHEAQRGTVYFWSDDGRRCTRMFCNHTHYQCFSPHCTKKLSFTFVSGCVLYCVLLKWNRAATFCKD